MADEAICVPILSEGDIVTARQQGRSLAEHAGFAGSDLAVIATAISELARNIVDYAKAGEICVQVDHETGAPVIVVTAKDKGPGIRAVSQAMKDGFSTGGGLGLGLPGVRRLMDEFEIRSAPGRGTSVTAKKRKH